MNWLRVAVVAAAWVAVVVVFLVRDIRAEGDREFIRGELARLARIVDSKPDTQDKPAPTFVRRGGQPSDSEGDKPDGSNKRTNQAHRSSGGRTTARR